MLKKVYKTLKGYDCVRVKAAGMPDFIPGVDEDEDDDENF